MLLQSSPALLFSLCVVCQQTFPDLLLSVESLVVAATVELFIYMLLTNSMQHQITRQVQWLLSAYNDEDKRTSQDGRRRCARLLQLRQIAASKSKGGEQRGGGGLTPTCVQRKYQRMAAGMAYQQLGTIRMSRRR
eukprot:GHVS01012400.1.p1 GENE.GHVS01012400.1~~GHVS01012400.1.p1  ORF type:complete len:135 (-),score=23.85 GHVS01012400.1:51-455(-)